MHSAASRRAASPRVSGLRPIVLLLAAVAAGCGDGVPAMSACRNLDYDESGLPRDEYLPCASEMIAALDELAPQAEATLQGTPGARADGEATLRRVRTLFTLAGGRNLLERWRDRSLTDLNVDINNALTHYEAFYMVRVLDASHPLAAQSRDAAKTELTAATRRHQEARSLHRRMR